MEKPYYFPGSVKIRLSGPGAERFLNIAVQRELHIWDISYDEEGYITFWTQVNDLNEMNIIRRKTGVRLRLTDRYGFLFLLAKNKGRKLMITGFLAFFLLLLRWSNFIWDISIDGNLKFSDQTIFSFLETMDVTNGMRKKEVSCENIEKELRDQFMEITWVSAEILGTRLSISIRENEALLSEIETDDRPCHLAAAKDGVIVRNVIRSGVPQVKVGDTVAAGQILAEGIIPVLDDAGNLVKINPVHADGEIYAKTTEDISFHTPLLYMERMKTGRVRKGFFISDLNHTFHIMFPAIGDNQWEFVTEQIQMKLFRNYYLPVYFGQITAYEISCCERKMSEDEVKKIMKFHLAEYMEKLTEKGVQILGCDGRIEQDESGWHYEGTLRLLENIAVEVAIPENQKENQTVNECN